MIVVEEDGRARIAIEFVQDHFGERAIHGHVALRPRVVQPVVETRRRLEIPEVVLNEPQRRVRDDVVEPVVRLLVVRDEPEAIRGAVARSLGERFGTCLLCDGAIFARHGARHPRYVVVHDETA